MKYIVRKYQIRYNYHGICFGGYVAYFSRNNINKDETKKFYDVFCYKIVCNCTLFL